MLNWFNFILKVSIKVFLEIQRALRPSVFFSVYFILLTFYSPTSLFAMLLSKRPIFLFLKQLLNILLEIKPLLSIVGLNKRLKLKFFFWLSG